jgi:hypothetical protein
MRRGWIGTPGSKKPERGVSRIQQPARDMKVRKEMYQIE